MAVVILALALTSSLLLLHAPQAHAQAQSLTVIQKAAKKAPYTVVSLFNRPNYKNKPASLPAAAVSFPNASPCQAIPAKFLKKVYSVKINFALVAAGGATRRTCSQVKFFTNPKCSGFSITFPKPTKANSSSTALVPVQFATRVVSISCV